LTGFNSIQAAVATVSIMSDDSSSDERKEKWVPLAKTAQHSSQSSPSKKSQSKSDLRDLTIVDYSDKAIAVIGDIITHSNELTDLGGLFNPKLKCGAGWIFSKKKRDVVQKYIDTGEVTLQTKQDYKSSAPSSSSSSTYAAQKASSVAAPVTTPVDARAQINKTLLKLKKAFDADADYTGSSIHDVIDQLIK
jgi:hypothetical protein